MHHNVITEPTPRRIHIYILNYSRRFYFPWISFLWAPEPVDPFIRRGVRAESQSGRAGWRSGSGRQRKLRSRRGSRSLSRQYLDPDTLYQGVLSLVRRPGDRCEWRDLSLIHFFILRAGNPFTSDVNIHNYRPLPGCIAEIIAHWQPALLRQCRLPVSDNDVLWETFSKTLYNRYEWIFTVSLNPGSSIFQFVRSLF